VLALELLCPGKPGNPEMAGAEWVSSQVKEKETGIDAGRFWFLAVSQHVLFCSGFFAGAAHSLGGAEQCADKRSEKVRQLWAR